MKLAVVGGGWAGLAAAVRTTEAGHAVTLFEMAAHWGGRAREVAVDGRALDNGQHILIGAYRRTLALMLTVGADTDALLLRRPLELRYPDGRGLQVPPGPAWLGFARAVAGCQGWTTRERLALMAAATGWALAGFRCAPQLTVAQLCRRLPSAVQELLVDPLCVAALNTPAREASATVFLRVLRAAVAAHFGAATQALALAWTAPFAVECNSITGALALGFDSDLCLQTCAPSRPSSYFNSPSHRPLQQHGWRPSMLLAAPGIDEAKALIDRGVAADGSLSLRGRPPVTAMMLATDDAARRVRMALYPPPGLLRAPGVDVRHAPAAELAAARHVVLAITGSVRLALDPAPDWTPGALADHLTSVGGVLSGQDAQSTVLEWIASGATASHGAVSEPCNHLQKFPHPQLLLLHYMQGSTAIEAYWKSVAWPQQSLFVGEPLAAPFARVPRVRP